MRSYSQKSRSGGGRYRGGDSHRRESGPREMHKAVCDACGRSCEVPFKPSGDKPIYCSNCFEEKDSGGSRRPDRNSSRRSGGGERDRTTQQLLDQVRLLNTKLDRILNVIESGVGKKKVAKKAEVKKAAKKATKKIVKKSPTKE